MSTDIGLLSFKDGKDATLSPDIVLKVLKPFVQVIRDVRYDEPLAIIVPGWRRRRYVADDRG
jgi:hypothetical protein